MDLRYTGYHKKVTFKLIFEFLSLEGCFVGVRGRNFFKKISFFVKNCFLVSEKTSFVAQQFLNMNPFI